MLNLRGNSFTENGIGEPEQDANSALTELDRGLRSGKIGEQCEAIVRFPRLFEKYPFPILINASFLKLADVFRMGFVDFQLHYVRTHHKKPYDVKFVIVQLLKNTNFLRLCVLRVCQQSEKHLDKISNVDEFVRRVFSVIHSNDPIARALTLRTLGAVAGIIPERQQVHHSIRRSLDSHDNVEIEAGIYAAIQFAEQSKTFAVSMCNKVSVMIQGQSTPANMKLQLIPILQYMHHDTDTAEMVRKLCLELLPTYPSEDFVLVILSTLTHLAAATLVDIPSQVSLLLNYLHKDLRWSVKSKVLIHLHELAKPGGHLWPPGAVDAITNTAMESKNPKILSLALDVLQCLLESPKMCYEHNGDSKLRQICAKNSYSPHPKIAAQSIRILTQILCSCYKKRLEVQGTDAVISSLETFILLLTFSNEKYPYQLKLALKCAVQLCEVRREYCETFVELLGSSLGKVDDECTNLICEALGAIGSLQPAALMSQLVQILTLLNDLSRPATTPTSTTTDSTTQHTNTKVMLCTLVFQTLCGYKWNDNTTKNVLKTVIASNNLWTNYRIARSAIRYSHHEIALEILQGLTERVSSEHLHFWLVCLKEMCEAETQLCAENAGVSLVDRLDMAVVHYNKGIAALKAASTPTHNLQFQAEYLRIRVEFLQCLVQLIHTCNILCIVPPPAIAQTIVQSTRDEFQKHGYITNQIRKCSKDFKNCGELYWKLYQTAFDADPATLENIQILQQMCVLLENCIEYTCTAGVTIGLDLEAFNLQSTRLESQLLIRGCRNATRIAQVISQDVSLQTITHKQVELLKKTVEALVNASLSVPRYFFQVLQSTSVKLAISPQPRVIGEFISVQSGTQLTVKVEGVIQHGQRPGLFRKVEGVIVAVTSQLQNTTKTKEFDTKNIETTSTLTQTVTPHRDFFTAQFLLAFPRGGQYLLTIEASVVDADSCTWKTGPRSTLTVKIPEESKSQAIGMLGMSGSGNVILMAEDNLFTRPAYKKL